jgi:hypothetical protein
MNLNKSIRFAFDYLQACEGFDEHIRRRWAVPMTPPPPTKAATEKVAVTVTSSSIEASRTMSVPPIELCYTSMAGSKVDVSGRTK